MTNPLTPDPLRIFRSETHELHQRLEATNVFSQLMRDTVTIEDYTFALQALLNCYSVLEPILIQGLHLYAPAYLYVPRLPLLLRDLDNLGANKTIHSDKTEMPQLSSLSKAETLGILYVIEGSTLGGQILSRHLIAKLGEQISSVLAFYSLDGKLTSQHWASTQRLLREQLCTAEEIEQALQSAKQSFEIFIHQQRH